MSDKISIEALNVKIPKLTVTSLAKKINAEIHNMGEDRELLGFSTLEAASEEGVSFVIKKKYLSEAAMSHATVIVAPKGMTIEGKTTLCVDNVWEAILFLLNHFYPEKKPVPGIHDSVVLGNDVSLGLNVAIDRLSVISDGVCIGDNSILGAQVYIGKSVKIGKDCMIHPNVTLLDRCEVGDRVILHSGVVVGSDGFKYELIGGLRTKIPQVGKVVIEDDVEIGANTTIDRASITETRIGARTKIDNLVQIAHNVTIGTDCYIVAQCGIAGSTTVGDRCILAGQVGIVDNVNITDDVIIGAQSGVSRDYKKPGMYIGSPAIERKQFLRLNAILSRLPTMYEDIKKLKQQLTKKK